METIEKYKTNKKIAIRFLKELGLLEAWKEYLKSDFKFSPYDKRKNLNNWYEEEYIDIIFGSSNFTYFLNSKKNYYSRTIAFLFRSYLDYMNIGMNMSLSKKYVNHDSIAQYKHIVNGSK